MQKFLVIHGPSLSLLGSRKPDIYGKKTLKDINESLKDYARSHDIVLQILQSNHEGAIVEAIHTAAGFSGIVINAGGYTHTSVAIRDALEAIGIPAIEVHLSNILAREQFRQYSMLAPVCVGQITGFGLLSYLLALEYFVELNRQS
jgi:3-dehydroquinate dehydratase-2